MKVGTRSVVFGIHQFILHPIIVTRAWFIVWRRWPALHEWAAILTHDLGYWGCANMDGAEGEQHPERIAAWWRKYFGDFGEKVAREVLGHSRFHAAKNGLPLSALFQPDKLATALYPRWLYLLLSNLSGEIHEYMGLCKTGKYSAENSVPPSQIYWLLEVQSNGTLMGLYGDKHPFVSNVLSQRCESHTSKRKSPHTRNAAVGKAANSPVSITEEN